MIPFFAKVVWRPSRFMVQGWGLSVPALGQLNVEHSMCFRQDHQWHHLWLNIRCESGKYCQRMGCIDTIMCMLIIREAELPVNLMKYLLTIKMMAGIKEGD
jgi:hypothetical protein